MCPKFSIVLLVNVPVSSQTFTNLVSSLVSTAKNRSGIPASKVKITESRVVSVIQVFLTSRYASEKNRTLNGNQLKISEYNIDKCMKSMRAAPSARMMNKSEGQISHFIGLQDAMNAFEEAGLQEKDLDNGPKAEEKPRQMTSAMTLKSGYRPYYRGFKRNSSQWRLRKQEDDFEKDIEPES